MKKYEWYLFDLDNTILDSNYASKKAFEKTLKIYSIDYSEKIYKVYHEVNNFYWEKYEKGKIDSETLRIGRFKDFLDKINFKINALEMSAKYLDYLVEFSIEIKGSFALLDKLAKTSNLALITNGLSDVQYKRIEKFGLDKYFKHIFISDEMGVSKPDKRFFDIVHSKINFPNKENVLVLGDNPNSDIQGANDFGYHSLFFNYNNYSKNVISNYSISDWKEF